MKKFLEKFKYYFFSKEGLKKFFFSFTWLMVLMFALDLISKWAVKNTIGVNVTSSSSQCSPVTIIPNFLFVTCSLNDGASFGMGSNGEIGWKIVWLLISVILSVGLIIFYIKKYSKLRTCTKVALALVISGAVGNLIDRAFYWPNIVGFSGVIDWISFSFFPPIFNWADSCLVVGVIILLIIVIIDSIKEAREKDKRGEYDLKPQDYKKMMEKEAKDNEKANAPK